ncbi:hypothetical protein BD560DRAFT_487665 [Blakeslea trispora]|nr:hypothetical protein BD560DRAFT_487665 [Blakeslea trispora]
MSQRFDLPPPNQPPPNNNNDAKLSHPSSTLSIKYRIIDYGPSQGNEGDSFNINVSLQSNLDSSHALRIFFDSCFTTCQLSVDAVNQIVTIHTVVPNPNLLTCNDFLRVPIYLALVMQDSQKILDSYFVGYFAYTSRKRSSSEYGHLAIGAGLNEESKRSRSDNLQSQPTSASTYNIPPTNFSPSSTSAGYYELSNTPYVGLSSNQTHARQREYFENPNILNYYRQNDPAASFEPSYGDAGSTYMTAGGSNPPSMLSAQSSAQTQEAYNMMPILEAPPSIPPQSHSMQSTVPSAQSSLNSPTTILPSSTPSLQIKPTQPQSLSSNTQMQPSNEPYSSSISPTSATGPNPFVSLLNKANLRIEGNLEDMLKNWTAEEWETQRRLVQFWRRQEGNEVTCRFATFTLPLEKSKQPDMSKIIVVSCIYWREKNDYFITSVDCIYLLENLIGVRFTVEEKNRIRRNLEGYKPLTVSKMKPESADFFKLIMGFPNPKPRNIEKDVKVFPWMTLGVALKKIISKYTASYSSTASVNYDALNSTTNPPEPSTSSEYK